ncbi:MAG: MBL fold metallo-hydrolase [Clostridia bacterium]|nr:MBL fold metallo-hydrolase [Clostridia bacterium]
MYELISVTKNTYYIDCPAKIGVYRLDDGEVYLIDSGNDKEAGKKIVKLFSEMGWTLKAVLNTHSNGDHIGGNKVLVDRLGADCFAKGIERTFAEHTILEPAFLYGGYPCKMLRNKFLMAESAPITSLTDIQLPKGFETISLPGHFFDMVGFRTPDDVIFLADCVFSENILKKYRVSFIYDVAEYLNTLDFIKSLKAEIFIPSHAEPCTDISMLVEINRQNVLQIIEDLVVICNEAKGFDKILAEIFYKYNLSMDFNQQVLVGSTIRSYLSYLIDVGSITVDFESNVLRYKTIR